MNIPFTSITAPKTSVASLIHVRTLINIPNIPVFWKRPEKIPFNHPTQTGDCVTRLEVDMNRSPVFVEESKEMETANDNVKRLFTFHFLGRKFAMQRAKEDMICVVKNHKYDDDSIEVDIARKTAQIRNFMEHYENYPYDKIRKTWLKELIENRRRRLRWLRKWDYKRFEWLLEKLDIIYRPPPIIHDRVEKKKSVRRLTQRYCDDYRERKLEKYRKELQDQKLDFLNYKIETLEWARKEEVECGVVPSVTEDQINAAKIQLQEYIELQKHTPKEIETSDNILLNI